MEYFCVCKHNTQFSEEIYTSKILWHTLNQKWAYNWTIRLQNARIFLPWKNTCHSAVFRQLQTPKQWCPRMSGQREQACNNCKSFKRTKADDRHHAPLPDACNPSSTWLPLIAFWPAELHPPPNRGPVAINPSAYGIWNYIGYPKWLPASLPIMGLCSVRPISLVRREYFHKRENAAFHQPWVSAEHSRGKSLRCFRDGWEMLWSCRPPPPLPPSVPHVVTMINEAGVEEAFYGAWSGPQGVCKILQSYSW